MFRNMTVKLDTYSYARLLLSINYDYVQLLKAYKL